jgi:DNA-binding transcriptional ArsR family regulator
MPVKVLQDAASIQAIAHPARLSILDALRTPDSAAGVARRVGQPRQRVYYHVKELERAGLLRAAGERRKGHFIEQLYQAAGPFVVSPRLASGEKAAQALRDQVALKALVDHGDRLQRDATALLERAAFAGVEIAAAAVEAELSFPDARSRSAFMEEYLALLGPLLEKHGAREGERFRVALAVYPLIEEEP